MKKGVCRSPLFYVGDKYKLIKEIKNYFPTKINRLIEPFVGGGSVFLNVDADTYLLNDINTHVIALHKMLCSYVNRSEQFFYDLFKLINDYQLTLSYKGKTVPQEFKTLFPKSYFAKYNNDAYCRLKQDFNNLNEKNFLQLYILLIYGFNRMIRFNKKGDFNVPVGNVDFNLNTYNALVDYFRLMEHKNVEWHNKDFRAFLTNIDYQDHDLVYLDPPYLITFSEYNKLWNEELENEMLGLLDNLNSNNIHFAISNVLYYKGKTNDKFLNWSTRYNSFPIKSNYISFNDNTIKTFKEVLVTNF